MILMVLGFMCVFVCVHVCVCVCFVLEPYNINGTWFLCVSLCVCVCVRVATTMSTELTLKLDNFNLLISLKLLLFKVGMLFTHLWLFDFHSPHLLTGSIHDDNPACGPAQ